MDEIVIGESLTIWRFWIRIWSIEWRDIYYFNRCPRIIMFKKLGAGTTQYGSYTQSTFVAYEIGQIDEEVFTNVLSSRKTRNVPGALGSVKDINLFSSKNGILKNIVHETFKGALKTMEYLRSVYGEIAGYASGVIINPLLQVKSKPDLVIIFPEQKHVIVEIKNTKRAEVRHSFQAGYYVTASRLYGALVLFERIEGPIIGLAPIHVSDNIEGIVVYPRLSRIEKAKILNITPEIVAKIMKAKYIANKNLFSAQRNSAYCENCSYFVYCENIKDQDIIDLDSVQLPIPLPIVASLELHEKHGIDLDKLFYGMYVEKLIKKLYLGMRRDLLERGENPLHIPPASFFKEYIEHNPEILELILDMTKDEIKSALENYKIYREILVKLKEKGNIDSLFPLTSSEADLVTKNTVEKMGLISRSLKMMASTCLLPSDSFRRVKEVYHILSKLLK